MEPWKSLSLLSPPILTTELKENIDVLGLRHTCDNIIRVLSRQSPLHKEAALVSRFIYKYDKKFRNDIGYRNIKKINSALHKYLQVHLLNDVENFTAVLPKDDDDFIPSRQMLEFVLSRIITFSKLMLRVYVCAKQAAVFFLDRVKKGESHWMSLMPYALLSRIRSLSAVLLQHAISWYSSLYPFLTLLQPKGLNFLPKNYELPKDLDEWLDIKNLDTIGKMNWFQKKTMGNQNVFVWPDDEDYDNTVDSILKYASQINDDNWETGVNDSFEQDSEVETLPKDQLLHISNVPKIDCGLAISRDTFKAVDSALSGEIKDQPKPVQNVTDQKQRHSEESCKILTNFQKKMNNDKSSHYFGSVTNVKSLNDFLEKEETFRNDGHKQSLTLHLSFMQWQSLKNSLLIVCNSISNNRTIERKLQKVWKDKCLDLK